MNASSTRREILLLEDEPIILMDLAFAVEDLDMEPLCATSVSEALQVIEQAKRLTVAVLDVSLSGGQTCVPVARALEQRGIPYVLHSGDLNRHNELVHSLGARHITKPTSADRVIAAAMELGGDRMVGRA